MQLKSLIALTAAVVVVAGCSSHKQSMDPFAGKGSPIYSGAGPMPKGGGRYHVGKPYQVAGNWFTPKEQPGYDKSGLASWYGEAFNRRKTSNGEWFNMNDLTAAHATLPLPSYAKVTNLENGRSVVVRINDRGPFVGTRIIDLSKASATALGYKAQGTAQVRVQWIGAAPLNDSGSHLLAMNQALGQGTDLGGLKQLASSPSQGAASVQFARNDQAAEPQQALYEAPATTQARNGYFIQVASFADQSNAISAKAALDGIANVRVIEALTDNGYVYRLLTAPMANEAEALSVMDAVQSAGFFDARLLTARVNQVAANP